MRRLIGMAVLCGALLGLSACTDDEADDGSIASVEEGGGAELQPTPTRSLTVESDWTYFSDASFTTDVGAKWRLCGGLQGHGGDTSTKIYVKTQTLCAPPHTTTIRCYVNNLLVPCP